MPMVALEVHAILGKGPEEERMKTKLMGAGVIAGATLVAYNRLRKPTPLEGAYADASTKILIVGGGFGGLAAARELARTLSESQQDVGVALLDRVNYTTFWPMVPSVIPSDVEVRHLAHSIRRNLRPLGVEFFQEEVTGVDFEASRVKTDDGEFSYRPDTSKLFEDSKHPTTAGR
jgi:NADH:ubiquinone reductase (H+-translocating)